MLMAVSCLSPVRTQILMSALIRVAMVSGTPAWRRSSMAVAPSNIRFCWERRIKTLKEHVSDTEKLLTVDLARKFRKRK